MGVEAHEVVGLAQVPVLDAQRQLVDRKVVELAVELDRLVPARVERAQPARLLIAALPHQPIVEVALGDARRRRRGRATRVLPADVRARRRADARGELERGQGRRRKHVEPRQHRRLAAKNVESQFLRAKHEHVDKKLKSWKEEQAALLEQRRAASVRSSEVRNTIKVMNATSWTDTLRFMPPSRELLQEAGLLNTGSSASMIRMG